MKSSKQSGAGRSFLPGGLWPYLLILALVLAAVTHFVRSYKDHTRELEKMEAAMSEAASVPKEMLTQSGIVKYPYVGMEEQDLCTTFCSLYDDHETVSNSEDGADSQYPITRYYWYSKDRQRKLVLQVDCMKKKVLSVERFLTDTYWYEDGSPDFTGRYCSRYKSYDERLQRYSGRSGSSGSGSSGSGRSGSSGSSGSGRSGSSGSGSSGSGRSGTSGGSSSQSGRSGWDPYGVEDYDDPEDFADDWADEFGDSYEEGYDDAVDYWEEEHED